MFMRGGACILLLTSSWLTTCAADQYGCCDEVLVKSLFSDRLPGLPEVAFGTDGWLSFKEAGIDQPSGHPVYALGDYFLYFKAGFAGLGGDWYVGKDWQHGEDPIIKGSLLSSVPVAGLVGSSSVCALGVAVGASGAWLVGG